MSIGFKMKSSMVLEPMAHLGSPILKGSHVLVSICGGGLCKNRFGKKPNQTGFQTGLTSFVFNPNLRTGFQTSLKLNWFRKPVLN